MDALELARVLRKTLIIVVNDVDTMVGQHNAHDFVLRAHTLLGATRRRDVYWHGRAEEDTFTQLAVDFDLLDHVVRRFDVGHRYFVGVFDRRIFVVVLPTFKLVIDVVPDFVEMANGQRRQIEVDLI